MVQINRKELAGLTESAQIYLFFGERYLCREAADILQKKLLSSNPGSVHAIDGDNEDVSKTLGQLLNFSILPGKQIYRVTDSKLFHSVNVAESLWKRVERAYAEKKEMACRRQLLSFVAIGGIENEENLAELSAHRWKEAFGFSRPDGNLFWADELLCGAAVSVKSGVTDLRSRYMEAFKKKVPPNNILILTAEDVDKRKAFFKFIKENGVAVDCSVDTGAARAAQTVQKSVLQEMVEKTLRKFQKKMAPPAIEQLFERVGFYPMAVIMEVEKLALYVGDRDLITVEDLQAMVGRTREDALFELTDAFGKRQVARTLVLLHRLQENGIHGLAIIATMRNYLRKLLIFRSLSLQSEPMYRRGMNAGQFQKEYLPALKKRGEWTAMLKGHPYALFMSFSKAQEFSCTVLKNWMELLLQAELCMKSSSLDSRLILEELFFTLLAAKRQER